VLPNGATVEPLHVGTVPARYQMLQPGPVIAISVVVALVATGVLAVFKTARYQGRRLAQITIRLLTGSRVTDAAAGDGNARATGAAKTSPDRVSGGLARRKS